MAALRSATRPESDVASTVSSRTFTEEACAYGETRSDAVVVALASATTASAQNSTTGSGQQPRGRHRPRQRPRPRHAASIRRASVGDPPGDDDDQWDTGLWFVPTGEVLPAKKWSLSAYRVNFDRDQGFTDVSDWPLTFGFGAGDRAEIFGAWTLVRRIDRDVRPLFVPTDPTAGGLVNEAPVRAPGLVGQSAGRSLARRQGEPDVAVAAAAGGVRAARDDQAADGERPTTKGSARGKMDFAIDAIVSKEVNERVEVSGFGGLSSAGDPDGIDLSNGLRWGFGVGVPSRKSLRFTAELHGESYLSDAVTLSDAARGERRERCRRW